MPKRAPAWPLAIVLMLASLWAYTTSFAGVFAGDDVDAIVNNTHIRSLWPLSTALSGPKDTTVAGRPVVNLTLAINYALARADPLDPWGYHALNLLIHIGAGLVLFGVVRRTLLSASLDARFGSAAMPIAFSVALLWLAHPLQTSAVTHVIQRAEALMGLFMLLTLYAAIRATDPAAERPRAWITAAVGACALGMASKEVMVVAPIVVFAWIWTFRARGIFDQRRTRVLLSGLASSWVLLALLVASDPRGESVGFGLGGWTWWSYLCTQAAVIVHYLRLAVVPRPLVFSYGWPQAASWIEVAPQFILLAALAGATMLGIVRRHPAGFLGACFFLILAPSSSVLPIPTEVAAEHRMYLPVAAVIAAVVPMAFVRLPRMIAWNLVAAVAVTFGVVTHERSRDYRSLEALMRDTVTKRPDNAKARVVLGGHLVGLERFSEAEAHLRAAIAIPPSPGGDPGLPALAHMYLGSALAAQNEMQEGIRMLEKARALNPSLGEVHAFLGEAYASEGRILDAVESFDRAIATLPDVPDLLERAARLRATAVDRHARDGARAVAYAERAVRLTGAGDLRLLDTLAAAYAESGRFGEAVATVHRAIEIAPPDPGTRRLLHNRLALYTSGQPLRAD
ncbi:MAG TPA: tetratricopeptide repeat protein [Vicinamibacterales bacterium]